MTNHHQPQLLSHQNAYPHFAGSRIKYTTQQSQSHQRDRNNTAKRVHTHPTAGIYIFFAHFSRFLQNGKQEAYIRLQKKKEKKGYKRHKKVLKGGKRYKNG